MIKGQFAKLKTKYNTFNKELGYLGAGITVEQMLEDPNKRNLLERLKPTFTCTADPGQDHAAEAQELFAKSKQSTALGNDDWVDGGGEKEEEERRVGGKEDVLQQGGGLVQQRLPRDPAEPVEQGDITQGQISGQELSVDIPDISTSTAQHSQPHPLTPAISDNPGLLSTFSAHA
ncbi:hypothetical protein L210DRAFT_3643327 [Boletus edulis BED1]|uniref:Uncharacterized protein n=1 Tax=Boletus edulis BED1 TaxID=1328754 RepID=A0AAD4BYM1_BOLED|nr:hypothetical protein L210DRAFT_3643327 [Boletus edulis BED1]